MGNDLHFGPGVWDRQFSWSRPKRWLKAKGIRIEKWTGHGSAPDKILAEGFTM